VSRTSDPAAASWCRHRLTDDLWRLGIRPGVNVLINSSFRAIGTVEGGPATVLAALRRVLGPTATIVVPAQTQANSTTSAAHRRAVAGMSDDEIVDYQKRFPPFDPARTPSEGMGAFAEYLRRRPEAFRSSHPTSSFAALGPDAERLTARHPLHSHLGPESPLGMLAASGAGAQVLLLGVGFAACTAFHLAEYHVRPQERVYRSKLSDPSESSGRWIDYRGTRLDASDFERIGADLAACEPGVANGMVGSAPSWCFPLSTATQFARRWMLHHRR
jgi:aminoglycoside 3-N-acetyltransferase